MQSFTCFLHTAGAQTSDLRGMSCEKAGLLTALAASLRQWPAFDMVDVYDHRDRPLLQLFHDRLSHPIHVPRSASDG
jgi:hypothetical protein